MARTRLRLNSRRQILLDDYLTAIILLNFYSILLSILLYIDLVSLLRILLGENIFFFSNQLRYLLRQDVSADRASVVSI